MNREQTARCFALVAGCYGIDANEVTLEAWHVILGQLDAAAAYAATVELCSTSNRAPKPVDIITTVREHNGDLPPTMEAAMGHYVAGEWSIHPAVQAAANNVYWDRFNAPDQAKWQFRDLYQAELDKASRGNLATDTALGQPAPIGELLEQAIRDEQPR